MYSALFGVLTIALMICAVIAKRSGKSIGASLSLLLVSLIPPVIGNLIIIASQTRSISILGCFIYFLGMDFVMYALLRFTLDYCHISWKKDWHRTVVYALLIIDVVQLLLNPIFEHAFVVESILVDGYPYYRMIPLAGQSFHRIADYSIFLAVLIIFIYKTVRSPRIYSERYSVILTSMVLFGLWQTFYIFAEVEK